MSRLSFSDRPAVLTPELPCALPNTPQLRSVHCTPLYTCVQRCKLYSSVNCTAVYKNVQCTRVQALLWPYVQCSRQLLSMPGGRLAGRWPVHRLHRHKMATSRHRHVANTQQLTPRRPPLSHDMSPMCSLALLHSLLAVSPRYLVRPWAGPLLPARQESSSASLVTRHSHCLLSSWWSDTSLHWWPLSAPDCRLGRPG